MGPEETVLDNLAKIRGNRNSSVDENPWNTSLETNGSWLDFLDGLYNKRLNRTYNSISGLPVEFNGTVPTLPNGPATLIHLSNQEINRIGNHLSNPIQGELSKLSSNDAIKMTTPILSEMINKDAKEKLKQLKNDHSFVKPVKPSFTDTINNNFEGANSIVNAANTAFTAIAGERSEFSGKEGDLAKSLDSTYDTIQDAVSLFGPYGKAASLAMGVGKLASNIVGKLGGGTDGMSKIDSILGSPFLLLSPFGLINGFGGKKSDTFAKDNELFSTMGSSYGGASDMADDALAVSGKKYGAFSSGALSEANQAIAEAKRQQTMISRINTEAQNRQALQSSMAGTNYNGYSLAMQGGYDQSGVRVGRFGMVFENNLQRAKNILKAQKGTLFYDNFLSNPLDSDAEFQAYLKSLPENLRYAKDFRVRDYWEFNGRPKDFLEAVLKGMFKLEPDGLWHASSVSENPKTGEIEFMKSSKHPSHSFEVDWYNSDEGKDFKKEYELVKSEPYWKYIKRKTPLKEDTLKLKEGGTIGSIINPIKPIFKTEEPIVQEFKEGGSFNVIPEGALHARKHNMENADNLTKKGIPVVSETKDGLLEQQAEIEREEIIYRLETTKKLEELYKKYNSEEYTLKEKDEFAIEAGKLLVYETLYNTLDNTGLLNKV